MGFVLMTVRTMAGWAACGLLLFLASHTGVDAAETAGKGGSMEIERTAERLKTHLTALTETIGERSIFVPDNLAAAADYIERVYRELGHPATRQPYEFRGIPVANLISEVRLSDTPSRRYLLGAHYDSVAGTVGADDNASAVAVQLEVLRALAAMEKGDLPDIAVTFVSFTLEEPPAFDTAEMGSRVYARAARKRGERIDGMICLEMVGYTCGTPGCQEYPFPLTLRDYPETGNFIGIVGNWASRGFSRDLYRAFQKNADLPAIRLTVPFNGWVMPPVRLSDHASFWDQGYKAVMVTDTSFYRNPHYHLAADTMETLDYRFMARLVESLVTFFRSAGR